MKVDDISKYKKASQNMEMVKAFLDMLRHSIFQGQGLGVVIGMLDLIKLSSSVMEDPAKVSLAEIEKNAVKMKEWFQGLERTALIADQKFSTEISFTKARDAMERIVEYCRSNFYFKHQKIEFGKISDTSLIWSDSFEVMFEELLINSLKYSPENSTIHIVDLNNGYYREFVIISDIQQNKGAVTGIPGEYQDQIFHPFFRLNNFFDERFSGEKMTGGLGLTVGEYITLKYDGYITIGENHDFVTGIADSKKRIFAHLGVRKS